LELAPVERRCKIQHRSLEEEPIITQEQIKVQEEEQPNVIYEQIKEKSDHVES